MNITLPRKGRRSEMFFSRSLFFLRSTVMLWVECCSRERSTSQSSLQEVRSPPTFSRNHRVKSLSWASYTTTASCCRVSECSLGGWNIKAVNNTNINKNTYISYYFYLLLPLFKKQQLQTDLRVRGPWWQSSVMREWPWMQKSVRSRHCTVQSLSRDATLLRALDNTFSGGWLLFRTRESSRTVSGEPPLPVLLASLASLTAMPTFSLE